MKRGQTSQAIDKKRCLDAPLRGGRHDSTAFAVPSSLAGLSTVLSS